jgi:hypothetical protein
MDETSIPRDKRAVFTGAEYYIGWIIVAKSLTLIR